MSMNFSREQMLLRQRLQAAGSPATAARLQQEIGGNATFLGADRDAIRAAARDLADAYPQMGRAQMTAFVRTLWQSRIHELRAVGAELLAERAALLEPADLQFLEQLLGEEAGDDIGTRLAGDVLGALVLKNKKLWRDLRRLAAASNRALQRAAVRACRLPLLHDEGSFTRFEEVTRPLFEVADDRLQQAIDELLAAAAAVHADAVRELAARHGRKVTIAAPKAAAKAKAAPAKPAARSAAGAKAAAKPAKPAKPAKKTGAAAPKRSAAKKR